VGRAGGRRREVDRLPGAPDQRAAPAFRASVVEEAGQIRPVQRPGQEGAGARVGHVRPGPPEEVLRILGPRAHPARGHVQEVVRVARPVREPGTEPVAPLDERDVEGRSVPSTPDGDEGAGAAGPDDDDAERGDGGPHAASRGRPRNGETGGGERTASILADPGMHGKRTRPGGERPDPFASATPGLRARTLRPPPTIAPPTAGPFLGTPRSPST
jgi:hypothetical protein